MFTFGSAIRNRMASPRSRPIQQPMNNQMMNNRGGIGPSFNMPMQQPMMQQRMNPMQPTMDRPMQAPTQMPMQPQSMGMNPSPFMPAGIGPSFDLAQLTGGNTGIAGGILRRPKVDY